MSITNQDRIDAAIAAVQTTMSVINGRLLHGDYASGASDANSDLRTLNTHLDALSVVRKELKQYIVGENYRNIIRLLGEARKLAKRVRQAQHATALDTSFADRLSDFAADESTDTQQQAAGLYEKQAKAAGDFVTGMLEGKGGENTGKMMGKFAGELLGSVGGPRGRAIVGAIGEAMGGKMGAAYDASVGKAEQEAQGYSELRRMLGTASVDFDTLRASTQHLTAGFNVSANDAVQLAKKFASVAAVTPDNDRASGLGQSLRDAIGFAQGYGIDAQSTSQFLATEQLYKVSRNEPDNKRLFAQLSEVAAYSGTSAKMGELLTVVSKFTESSANQTLMVPDVSAYASLLSAMMASSTPGLSKNPTNAATVLDAADKGFREASKKKPVKFLTDTFRRTTPGFGDDDLKRVQAGGLFNSFAKVYGKDSQAMELAGYYNDTKAIAHNQKLAANSEGILSQLMDRFVLLAQGGEAKPSGKRKRKGKHDKPATTPPGQNRPVDTEKLVQLVQDTLNMSVQQATSLVLAYNKAPEGMGKLEPFLEKYGYDVNKLQDLSVLPALAMLAQGGDQAFDEQYQTLLKHDKVTPADKERLDKLDHSSKDFKSEVIKLVVKDSSDPALKTQTDQIKIETQMLEYAAQMLPLTSGIKQVLLAIMESLPDELKGDAVNAIIGRERLSDAAETLKMPIAIERYTDAQSRESGDSLEAIEKPLREHPNDPEALKEARAAFLKTERELQLHPDKYGEGFGEALALWAEQKGLLKSPAVTDALGHVKQYEYSTVTMPVPMRGVTKETVVSAEGFAAADKLIKPLSEGVYKDEQGIERAVKLAQAAVARQPRLYPENTAAIIEQVRQDKLNQLRKAEAEADASKDKDKGSGKKDIVETPPPSPKTLEQLIGQEAAAGIAGKFEPQLRLPVVQELLNSQGFAALGEGKKKYAALISLLAAKHDHINNKDMATLVATMEAAQDPSGMPLTAELAKQLGVSNANSPESIQKIMDYIWKLVAQKTQKGILFREALGKSLGEVLNPQAALSAEAIAGFMQPAPAAPAVPVAPVARTKLGDGKAEAEPPVFTLIPKLIPTFDFAKIPNNGEQNKSLQQKAPYKAIPDIKDWWQSFSVPTHLPNSDSKGVAAKIPYTVLVKSEQQNQARFEHAIRLSFSKLDVDIKLLNYYGVPIADKTSVSTYIGQPVAPHTTKAAHRQR